MTLKINFLAKSNYLYRIRGFFRTCFSGPIWEYAFEFRFEYLIFAIIVITIYSLSHIMRKVLKKKIPSNWNFTFTMKKTKCPNCGSLYTTVDSKYSKSFIGLFFGGFGIMILFDCIKKPFLLIIAIPVCCYAGIKLYKGMYLQINDCRCETCNYKFITK